MTVSIKGLNKVGGPQTLSTGKKKVMGCSGLSPQFLGSSLKKSWKDICRPVPRDSNMNSAKTKRKVSGNLGGL